MTAGVQSWSAIDWTPHVHDATVDGRILRYVDYGDGDPLLLIHGMGGSWQSWLTNIAELGRNHRVIAVDLPGFGGSDPLAAGTTFDGYLDALVGLLDELGLPSAVVFGHSLGGLVALSFASAHPDRTRGLALASGGGIVLSRFRLALIQAVFGIFRYVFAIPGFRWLLVNTGLRHLAIAAAVRRPREIPRELLDQMLPRAIGSGFLAAVRLGGQQLQRFDPRLVVAPVLLVWGREDRILPLAGGQQLAEGLSDAELVVLDDVGHCAMFEAPDAFNHLTGRFVDELGGDFDHKPAAGLF